MENMAAVSSTTGNEMFTAVPTSSKATKEDNLNESDLDSDELNDSSETAIIGDVEDVADSSSSSTSTGGSLSQRRNLPRRACKENSGLSKVKRRSILKPTKRNTSRSCDFSMLRPAEIKKIYCNQKLNSFRPTNLETIFEDPQPADKRRSGGSSGGCRPASAATSPNTCSLRFIGLKKIRRSLSCSDGLNTNKMLVKQRRAKIKKVFGRRSVCKKISLSDFIDRLNKSLCDDDADIEDAVGSDGSELGIYPSKKCLTAGITSPNIRKMFIPIQQQQQQQHAVLESAQHNVQKLEGDKQDEPMESDMNSSLDDVAETSSSSLATATTMAIHTPATQCKTEFTMLSGSGAANNTHHIYNNQQQKIGNCAPFASQNSFAVTLAYARDAASSVVLETGTLHSA